MRPPVVIALLAALAAVGGCGSGASTPQTADTIPATLLAQVRPVGAGPRFQPPAPDRPVRDCRAAVGARDGVHVELFARDRVVIIGAGIGTRTPRRVRNGRVVAARCYGPLVTLDPTGLVLVRRGHRATLGDLFSAWGQPLGARRAASFAGPVSVFVGGRRVRGAVASVPLNRHGEIVVELGPYVPPHRTYAFPTGS